MSKNTAETEGTSPTGGSPQSHTAEPATSGVTTSSASHPPDRERIARYEKTYDEFLKTIRDWKAHWMMKEPGYQARALGVDANMVHHLARRLTDAAFDDTKEKA